MKDKPFVKSLVNAVIGVASIIAIWFIAYIIISNSYVMPSPLKVIKEFVIITGEASFLKALAMTLLRVIIAFIISLILATILAVLAYKYPSFSDGLSVIIGFLRSLPVLAVLLIILLFTARTIVPIVVATMSLLPILYTAIYSSLRGVDSNLLEMCKVYGVKKKDKILSVYLPIMKPKLILDATAGIAFSLKLVVSSEIMANVFNSLGGFIEEAFLYSETAQLFALTIWTAVIGIIVEFIGKKLSHKSEVKS